MALKSTVAEPSADKNRILIAISSDATCALDKLADKERISRTELVRRALALYMLIDRELSEDPGRRKLAIAKGDKVIEQIIFS